jgi:ATP-dependent metalloprotease
MFPLLLLLAFSKNVSSETDLLSEMLSGKNVNKEERNITTRFSDVLGIDEFKDELIEIVDYLKHP